MLYYAVSPAVHTKTKEDENGNSKAKEGWTIVECDMTGKQREVYQTVCGWVRGGA